MHTSNNLLWENLVQFGDGLSRWLVNLETYKNWKKFTFLMRLQKIMKVKEFQLIFNLNTVLQFAIYKSLHKAHQPINECKIAMKIFSYLTISPFANFYSNLSSKILCFNLFLLNSSIKKDFYQINLKKLSKISVQDQ